MKIIVSEWLTLSWVCTECRSYVDHVATDDVTSCLTGILLYWLFSSCLAGTASRGVEGNSAQGKIWLWTNDRVCLTLIALWILSIVLDVTFFAIISSWEVLLFLVRPCTRYEVVPVIGKTRYEVLLFLVRPDELSRRFWNQKQDLNLFVVEDGNRTHNLLISCQGL